MSEQEKLKEEVEKGKKTYWVPLESNPAALNKFSYLAGMPDTWAWQDCWGLDPDLLAFVQQPVIAVILLFPYDNPAIKAAKEEQRLALVENPQEVSENAFWMVQHVGNACGTIAVCHSLINKMNRLGISADSPIGKFAADAKPLSYSDRGYLLGAREELQRVHEQAANVGQTEAPEAEAKVGHHFIAFAEVDGALYEFDGGKINAIKHKEGVTEASFLSDAAEVIKQHFFAKDPQGTFSIVLLGPNNQ